MLVEVLYPLLLHILVEAVPVPRYHIPIDVVDVREEVVRVPVIAASCADGLGAGMFTTLVRGTCLMHTGALKNRTAWECE